MSKLISFVFCLFVSLLSMTARPSESAEIGVVTLSNSARYSLYSEEINQTYIIDVALPQTYRAGDSGYPVLYVTDGIPLFNLVASNMQLLALGGVQESVVVGISYEGNFMDQLVLRERDMTPTNDPEWDSLAHQSGFLPEEMKSGGAELFLQFIERQVKPLINSNFRIHEDSETLLGHSNGGLFGLYVLFTQPDAFENYVLTSPATGWHDGVIFAMENDFATGRTDLSKKLFLAAGSLEPPTDAYTKRLYDALVSRNYGGLNVEYTLFEGETHTSVAGAALNRGIRYIYSVD